eukprot:6487781-Amphidinium_carterae.1
MMCLHSGSIAKPTTHSMHSAAHMLANGEESILSNTCLEILHASSLQHRTRAVTHLQHYLSNLTPLTFSPQLLDCMSDITISIIINQGPPTVLIGSSQQHQLGCARQHLVAGPWNKPSCAHPCSLLQLLDSNIASAQHRLSIIAA